MFGSSCEFGTKRFALQTWKTLSSLLRLTTGGEISLSYECLECVGIVLSSALLFKISLVACLQLNIHHIYLPKAYFSPFIYRKLLIIQEIFKISQRDRKMDRSYGIDWIDNIRFPKLMYWRIRGTLIVCFNLLLKLFKSNRHTLWRPVACNPSLV